MVETRRGTRTGRLEEQQDALSRFEVERIVNDIIADFDYQPLSPPPGLLDEPTVGQELRSEGARYRARDIYKRHRLPDSSPYTEQVVAHKRRKRAS